MPLARQLSSGLHRSALICSNLFAVICSGGRQRARGAKNAAGRAAGAKTGPAQAGSEVPPQGLEQSNLLIKRQESQSRQVVPFPLSGNNLTRVVMIAILRITAHEFALVFVSNRSLSVVRVFWAFEFSGPRHPGTFPREGSAALSNPSLSVITGRESQISLSNVPKRVTFR